MPSSENIFATVSFGIQKPFARLGGEFFPRRRKPHAHGFQKSRVGRGVAFVSWMVRVTNEPQNGTVHLRRGPKTLCPHFRDLFDRNAGVLAKKRESRFFAVFSADTVGNFFLHEDDHFFGPGGQDVEKPFENGRSDVVRNVRDDAVRGGFRFEREHVGGADFEIRFFGYGQIPSSKRQSFRIVTMSASSSTSVSDLGASGNSRSVNAPYPGPTSTTFFPFTSQAEAIFESAPSSTRKFCPSDFLARIEEGRKRHGE
jgi:hypothetical protein